MCRAGSGGPSTLSRTTDANLDCAFVENALFLLLQKLEGLGLPLASPICSLDTSCDRDLDDFVILC